jgi:ribosome maturation factor RimP
MTDTPVIQRVRDIVEPIASDLELDLYDLEQRGGTLRITVDTPPGSPGGLDMDKLALATRLISREMDHQDPIPGKYTLEVSTPGVERSLRLPYHFQREVGKTVNIRLADADADADAEQRRIEGVLVAADDTTATVRVGEGDDAVDRVVELAKIDRARTVFVWGPQPKPGGKGAPKKKSRQQSSPSPKSQSSKKESS